MRINYRWVPLLFCLAFSFGLVKQAHAAQLLLIPGKHQVAIGESVTVDVVVNSEDESINAAQGSIRFSSNLLEVSAVEKGASVFTFWIQEPSYSNETGISSFIGGTPKGVSGSSLLVYRVIFKAKAAGSASLSLTDAAITASDGQGTNILSAAAGTTLTIGGGTYVPTPIPTPEPTPPEPAPEPTPIPIPEPTPTPVPVQVPQPQPVLRRAVPSTVLPDAPSVNVPFYPDPSKWYSHMGDVVALWNVPDDVTHVAASVDQNPNTEPDDAEPVLVNGKDLGSLGEGVSFLHVRFRNNRGWGPTTHYGFKIDTTPPSAFELRIDSLASDNPAPFIRFDAFDALSGISNATILVDGNEVLDVATTTAQLPPQSLGVHALIVRVFDRAGNSVEDDVSFEVLPLPTPALDFVPRALAFDELLYVSGDALPESTVLVKIDDKAGREVFQGTAAVDSTGNWSLTSDGTFPPGTYVIAAIVRDDRGAMSRPTGVKQFRVRPQTIISLGGGVDLGWFEIFIILAVIFLSASTVFVWWYLTRKNMSAAYKTVIGRDIENYADSLTKIAKHIDMAARGVRDGDPRKRILEIKAYVKRLIATIEKMRRYLGEEVRNKK